MRLLTAGLAAVVLIVGQIGLRTPSGGSEAYGLSVSDLAEYPAPAVRSFRREPQIL